MTEAVVNNTLIGGLIDTGSEVTAISWTWFLQHSGRPKLKPPNAIIKTATKEEARVQGVWSTCIQIKNKTIPVNILIIKGLSQDLIIGMDVLSKGKVTLDFSGTEWLPSSYDVLARRSYGLKVGQTRMVKAKVNPSRGGEVVVLNKWTGQDECYCVDDQGNFNLIISNLGTLDAEIRRGESLARQYKKTAGSPIPSQSRIPPPEPPGKKLMGVLRQISLESIPVQFQREYASLIKKFGSIFSQNELDVGKTGVVRQHVVLRDPNKITNVPPYRLAPHLRPVAEEYISKLLA